MSPPLEGADLVRHLHDVVIGHAEALARTPGATPFAVAVCLLSAALGLLEDPSVCPPELGRAVLRDLLNAPTTPPAVVH